MHLSALSLMAALAAVSPSPDPAETPILSATGTLSYDVEMTGERAGRLVSHRITVTTPVSSRGSGPVNLLGEAFTPSQQAEVEAMSAATSGDGEADILAAAAALDDMIAVCAVSNGEACRIARARYEAAEAVLSDHAAQASQAQAAVVRDETDDHRFLMLMPGEQGQDCGSVDAVWREGARHGQAHLPPTDLASCQTMAVLDRRTGDLALRMSPATVKIDQMRVVNLAPLADTAGLKLGALLMSVTLPLQPTELVDGRYAGSRTIEAGGMTYRFNWRLKID